MNPPGVTLQWVNLALAAVAIGQLVLTELMSRVGETFSRHYFAEAVKLDTTNELGLPSDSMQRERLLDEMHQTGRLSSEGTTVVAAQAAAVAACIATAVLAAERGNPLGAWTVGAAGVLVAISAVSLISQLLMGKLKRFRLGQSRKVGAIRGYFQRVGRFETLTPYKTITFFVASALALVGAVL